MYALLFLAFAAHSAPAHWVPVERSALDGADPCDGTPTRPLSVRFDGSELQFRIRGLANDRGIGLLVEADWDPKDPKYDHLVWLDDEGQRLTLWSNTFGGPSFDEDPPEQMLLVHSLSGPSTTWSAMVANCSDGWVADIEIPWAEFGEAAGLDDPTHLGFAAVSSRYPGPARTTERSDGDYDGLPDGLEAEIGSDPSNADSDAGGALDGAEVRIYHTNPLDPLDDFEGGYDLDRDGLSDWEEVRVYGTHPHDLDGDHDGLTDGHEVLVTETDPRDPDSDGDGLTDGEELQVYKTDPLDGDTDGGGVPDGAEVGVGTDPLDPRDDHTRGTSASGAHYRGGGGAARGDGEGESGGLWSLLLALLLGEEPP